MKYCPNCIVPLTTQTKKLGKGSKKWLICLECGHREKENTWAEQLELEAFLQRLKETNLNGINYD